jgi:hypothetical protein
MNRYKKNNAWKAFHVYAGVKGYFEQRLIAVNITMLQSKQE